MNRKHLLWGVGGLVVLVVGGLVVVSATGDGIGFGEDDDAEERLSVDLAPGEDYTLEATIGSAPHDVEAGYEMKNTGEAPARVTLTLTGPDGEAIGTRTADIPVGKSLELEIEHAFNETAAGAAGTYTATIVVESGSVHLTEGEVEFNEREDDANEGRD